MAGRKRVFDEPVKSLQLRLPAALWAELARAAREEYRSINGQLVSALRDWLRLRKKAGRKAVASGE